MTKIVKFTAENVMRLHAVEIEPDGTLQVVSGKNAQGKSSVMNGIWLALGGGAASREVARPIRDGEEEAFVELDLGDLKVTRTWKGDKTSLKVVAKDGASYSSPQSVLNEMVGRLSFDPLEFTRLDSKEQLEALLNLVDLGKFDPEENEASRRAAYDLRREIGQRIRALGDRPRLDPDLEGGEPLSYDDLRKQISAAQLNDIRRSDLTATIEQNKRKRKEIKEKIRALKDEIGELDEASERAQAELDAVPDTAELDDLIEKMGQVQEYNEKLDEYRRQAERVSQIDELQVDYDRQTEIIEKLQEKRSKALSKAKMPVPGLGFDDDGVLYNGVPFSQASSAEQIRVSLAMAMSMNPDLRVVRILDGSLLDEDSMKIIEQMASENDYQVWIERVAVAGVEVGVVIEDGRVIKSV